MRSGWRTLVAPLLVYVLTGVALPTRAADSFSFITIDAPGASETTATGINGAGQIVGIWTTKGGIFWPGDVDGQVHGYVRSAHGAFTTFDVPGATRTYADGMNAAGQIVGHFGNGNSHGYLRAAGGTFTTIDAPGARATYASGINDAGQIVGTFEDAGGKSHGYLRTVGGTFTTIDAPGATATYAYGINDAGQIVGNFEDPSHKTRGYVRSTDGALTTFDLPGLVFASGINAAGQVVGFFEDDRPSPLRGFTMTGLHGYLRGADGAFTTIDVLGAIGNIAMGIHGVGQIVGYFQDARYTMHGYVTKR